MADGGKIESPTSDANGESPTGTDAELDVAVSHFPGLIGTLEFPRMK